MKKKHQTNKEKKREREREHAKIKWNERMKIVGRHAIQLYKYYSYRYIYIFYWFLIAENWEHIIAL